MLKIYIDADACPVKEEVYRVALRYELDVLVVANSGMGVPGGGRVRLIVVGKDLDAADDWIAGNVEDGDIVITADIPLAARCIEKGAAVIGPGGKPFTEENIGEAVATRGLLSELRETGEITGGPPPFGKKDRSRFLQRLDETIHAIRRKGV